MSSSVRPPTRRTWTSGRPSGANSRLIGSPAMRRVMFSPESPRMARGRPSPVRPAALIMRGSSVWGCSGLCVVRDPPLRAESVRGPWACWGPGGGLAVELLPEGEGDPGQQHPDVGAHLGFRYGGQEGRELGLVVVGARGDEPSGPRGFHGHAFGAGDLG